MRVLPPVCLLLLLAACGEGSTSEAPADGGDTDHVTTDASAPDAGKRRADAGFDAGGAQDVDAGDTEESPADDGGYHGTCAIEGSVACGRKFDDGIYATRGCWPGASSCLPSGGTDATWCGTYTDASRTTCRFAWNGGTISIANGMRAASADGDVCYAFDPATSPVMTLPNGDYTIVDTGGRRTITCADGSHFSYAFDVTCFLPGWSYCCSIHDPPQCGE